MRMAHLVCGPEEVRAEAEAELERLGLQRFATALAEKDPATAAALDLNNPRRVLRAWEVLAATGDGLAAWKARTPEPMLPLSEALAIALTPDRARLYERCEARFDAMLAAGALDEVRAVSQMGLPAAAPGLKAVEARRLHPQVLVLDTALPLPKKAFKLVSKKMTGTFRSLIVFATSRIVFTSASASFPIPRTATVSNP